MSNSFFKSPTRDGDYLYFEITYKDSVEAKEFSTDGNITFNRCVFKDFNVFEDISANEISFTNCIFESNLYFSKSKCKGLTFYDCSFHELNLRENVTEVTSLTLVKCNHLEVSGSFYSLGISKTEVDKVFLREVNNSYSNTKITLYEGNVFNSLEIKGTTYQSSIKILGGIYESIFFESDFHQQITFEGSFVKNLYLESSTFHKRIDFIGGIFDYVSFYRSIFQSIVHIEQRTSSNILNIKDLTFHSSTFFKNVIVGNKLEVFNSSNCSYNEILRINLKVQERTRENLLFISFDEVNQGTIVFEEVYASIDFRGFNEAKIYFKDLFVDLFVLKDFQNAGTISVSNLKSGRFFIVENSITGELNFLNSNVNIFREIVMVESNIEKINFNIYPNKILSASKDPKIGYGVYDKSKQKINLTSIYNQLKKNAKEKGNVDAANKFQSLEYRQLLFSRKFGFDNILLFLNLISNNNGRSWFQGVLFTLLTGFCFYIWYISTFGIFVDLRNESFFKEYIIFISSFPKLEIDKYDVYEKKWDTYLVIWLSRIFISYGIYQTVAAFRKYGKL